MVMWPGPLQGVKSQSQSSSHNLSCVCILHQGVDKHDNQASSQENEKNIIEKSATFVTEQRKEHSRRRHRVRVLSYSYTLLFPEQWPLTFSSMAKIPSSLGTYPSFAIENGLQILPSKLHNHRFRCVWRSCRNAILNKVRLTCQSSVKCECVIIVLQVLKFSLSLMWT